MTKVILTVNGVHAIPGNLAAKFHSMNKWVKEAAIIRGLMAARGYIMAEVKFYPPRNKRTKAVWKSERQRRYFFWALRKGIIRVPYRRTGTLGRSWISTSETTAKGTQRVRIGTRVKYAPYVMGDKQSPHHVGIWRTVEQIVRRRGPKAAEIAARVIAQEIEKKAKLY